MNVEAHATVYLLSLMRKELRTMSNMNTLGTPVSTFGTPVSGPTTHQELAVRQQLPVTLSPSGNSLSGVTTPAGVSVNSEQEALIAKSLQSLSIHTVTMPGIVEIGGTAEKSLQQTLDGYLARIKANENPRLFELVRKLKTSVDAQELPALADKILNGDLSPWQKLLGMASPAKLQNFIHETWLKTKQVAAGKTKTLVDEMNTLGRELDAESRKVAQEVDVLGKLKENYKLKFGEFVIATCLAHSFVSKAQTEIEAFKATADPNEPTAQQQLRDLDAKYQSLQSRALALEGMLTRIPVDYATLQQLEMAAVTTMQETAVTSGQRFNSIKMTLIQLNAALTTQGLQMVAEQNATLDRQLNAISGKVMGQVVNTAANAAGNNRLAQAEQIKELVKQTTELVQIAENAKASNAAKFAQASQSLEQSRAEITSLMGRV